MFNKKIYIIQVVYFYMVHNEIKESTDITTALIFTAILLSIVLLAIVIVVNSMTDANNTFNNYQVTPGNATNESGYLNSDGYALSEGNGNWIITQVVRQIDNVTLSPGNYTLINGVVYNATDMNC